jgi:predicted dehydrogenase
MAGKVDAVYIATPAGLHADHARACLEAGLPVLVEKPFAASAAEAMGILELAERRGLFVMEGMWTRFLPAARAMAEAVAAGEIGQLRLLSGCFCLGSVVDPRQAKFQPAMGGGALRYYGVYPLALGQMLAGPAASVHAEGTRLATGVDDSIALTVQYRSGAVGNYFASFSTFADNGFAAHGTGGQIALTGPVFRPAGLRLMHAAARTGSSGRGGRLRASAIGERLVQLVQHHAAPPGKRTSCPFPGNGYNLEAAEAQRCIEAGLAETPVMPHSDTLELARLVDMADAQLPGISQ